MKMTHRITITMLAHSSEVARGFMSKAQKLLKNSGMINTGQIDEIDATHSKVIRTVVTGIEEVPDSVKERFRGTPELTAPIPQINMGQPKPPEPSIRGNQTAIIVTDELIETLHHRHRPTIHMMTRHATLYLSHDPIDPVKPEGNGVTRITVSSMFPHYSSTITLANELTKFFAAIDCDSIISVYSGKD